MIDVILSIDILFSLFHVDLKYNWHCRNTSTMTIVILTINKKPYIILCWCMRSISGAFAYLLLGPSFFCRFRLMTILSGIACMLSSRHVNCDIDLHSYSSTALSNSHIGIHIHQINRFMQGHINCWQRSINDDTISN